LADASVGVVVGADDSVMVGVGGGAEEGVDEQATGTANPAMNHAWRSLRTVIDVRKRRAPR
jgi:hypothetical protein